MFGLSSDENQLEPLLVAGLIDVVIRLVCDLPPGCSFNAGEERRDGRKSLAHGDSCF